MAVAELLTPAEAGKLLDITPNGVRKASDQGRLKVAALTASGRRLYRRVDVEKFMKKREKSGVPAIEAARRRLSAELLKG
jgi:predicted site-specific integrase-resolvase